MWNGHLDIEIKRGINIKRRPLQPNEQSNKSDGKKEQRQDVKDFNLNIKSEMPVNVVKEKNPKEIDNILRLVCACLNSQDGFELTLTNKRHDKANTQDFDIWYDRIEKNMKRYFSAPICKFIDIYGNCNSEKIRIHVKQRAPQLCSLDTYLYYPSVSAVEQVAYTEAIDILNKPRQINKAEEMKMRSYRMFDTLDDFRNENVNLQFKSITGDSVSTTLSNMCLEYISAFCNHKGGLILFGIEDKEGKVVGVTIHSKTDIENKLKEKIASLKFGSFDGKMEKGVNWDIDYFSIKMDGEFYRVERDEQFFLKYEKEQTLELMEENSTQWWTLRNFENQRGLARADSFEKDQKTWYKVSKNDGAFEKGDIVTMIGDEEEINMFKCKSGNGKLGTIRKTNLVKDISKWYTAKCNGTGKKPYEKGEVLKLISKDNGEWWNFETVNNAIKQLPASAVKVLNDDSCDGQEHEKEDSEKTQVIALSVGTISGGVFTADPESYYADDKGQVHKYTFEDWKSIMIKSEKDAPFTKRSGEEMQLSINELSVNNDSAHNETIEVLKETASDISLLKDIVTSWKTTSQTPKRSKGTEVIKEDISEIFLVPSNLFEHHVTHDYKRTRNDEKIKEILENHNCVTVKGYIGTGKSQLALRYGLNMKNSDTLVWQFNCSDIQALWRSTSDLCKELHYKVKDTQDKTEDVHLMIKTINVFLETNQTKFHILIFDNVVEDLRLIVKKFIDAYLAKGGNRKVLVTSSFSVTDKELEITGFSEEEAINFLDAIEGSDEDGAELVKTFSCNPLGLKIAKTYIKDCQISIGAFLGILSSPQGAKNIENSVAIKKCPELKPLFQSLRLILNIIQSDSPSILQRILMMQFLCADTIPVILLENAQTSLFSGNITTEGSESNFECINNVISTLKRYSFATVSGNGYKRVFHTHSAILLALKSYTSETLKSNDITSMYMLKALLWAVVCLMHKDNRQTVDLVRHTSLLPHAESILNHTSTLLENDEAVKKQFVEDISFSLPLVYVSDIVGYTYDFDEMHHLGEKYSKITESYFMKMVERSLSSHSSKIADMQVNAEKSAAFLYENLRNIVNKNENMLNTIGKWYVLNKHRSENELIILENGLQVAGKSLNGKLKTEEDLNLLCENNLAVPKSRMGYFYLFEVCISLLYSYGRRPFYTMVKTSESLLSDCSYVLDVADHLSNLVIKEYPDWKILHHLLIKRSGTIQKALIQESNLTQTDMKSLTEIADQCLRSLEEKSRYFLFGTLCLETENDDFNKVIWMKQLVKCYKIMLNVATEESQKNEIEQRAKEHVKKLEGLIEKFESTSSFPGLIICIGEFYKCIRDFQSAKATFKKLFPKDTQVEQKVKIRKHVRKAHINYFHCLMLETRNSILENVRSDACGEIKLLVAKCYKILMNHEELKELEDILFNSMQEIIMEHEKTACYVYLENRLLHLQNGDLETDVFKQHVKEIAELLNKYSNMPLNHETSGLSNMKNKLSDLRNNHNA
ncbi:unnamed protein product [Mytilus coruscus]|uniref:Schlafen AlbA-2 domain-containing protein n=1 Tax=Mytilus coruscus TaxID=42192 RepID=A0A6J8CV51_MYTCO|nr:unnamed protein product [Mytilus coruscus]